MNFCLLCLQPLSAFAIAEGILGEGNNLIGNIKSKLGFQGDTVIHYCSQTVDASWK